MLSEKEMRETLDALVLDLINRSSFFRAWKPGQIDHSLSERFLTSFDTLVKSFPALIALGASRMKDEATRTVLAVNLYQECGEGDITRTHYAIYRKFLTTSGISLKDLTESSFGQEWRANLFDYLNGSESTASVLGALAAGEFLAQPALTRIYQVIQPQYPLADQEYFTKHLVLEEEHVKEITSMIAREAQNEEGWRQAVEGFKFGLTIWETYFDRLAQFVIAVQ